MLNIDHMTDEWIDGGNACHQDIINLRDALVSLRTATMALSADMHEVSTRPCLTCQRLTVALGHPFGCVAYARKGK